MSTRIGRPKADNPKDCDIKVRLDSETHRKLLEYCKVKDITKAEAVRKGVHLLLEQKK